MSINATITSFALTQVWTETLAQSPSPQIAKEASMGVLGNKGTYQLKFSELQGALSPITDLFRLPWQTWDDPPRRQRFWLRYTNVKRSLYDLDKNQAWKMLVPMVIADREGMSSDGQQPCVNLRAQGFVYPHGLSLVLTALVNAELEPFGAVELARKIRYERAFKLSHWSEAQYGMGQVATACLKECHELAARGIPPRSDFFDLDAFTLFTILDADSIPADAEIQPGDTLHRALYAVTSWKNTWQADLPTSFNDLLSSHQHNLTAPIKPAELLLGTARSRAYLSAPRLALHNPNELTCYHHNLVLASMQTESLSGLVREIAKGLATGSSLSGTQESLAENATWVLSRLHGGASDIYRSWSTRMQIQQNAVLPDLNTLRQRYGKDPML